MNSRLEQYVEEVGRGLEGLSETRRTEELAEIRQHLKASVAAHQELGMDEPEATEAAIEQFGSARLVSASLQRALWREKTFIPDTVVAAAIVSVAGSLALADMIEPFASILNAPFGPTLTLAYLLYWGAWRVLPRFAVGFLVGRLAPKNGVRGICLGGLAYLAYTTICLVIALSRNNQLHLLDHWWEIGSVGMSQAFYGIAVVVAPTLTAILGRRSASKTVAEWGRTKLF